MSRRNVAGALLATSIAFGLTGSSETPPPVDLDTFPAMNSPLTAHERHELRAEFRDVKHFWQTKKAGIAAVTLEIVTGDELVTCDDGQDPTTVAAYSEGSGALSYCRTSDQVILNTTGINTVNYIDKLNDAPPHSGTYITIAHELGHAVQDARGELHTNQPLDEVRERELQADYLGGFALRVINTDASTAAMAFYQALNPLPDPSHGTAAQRYDAFYRGLQGTLDGFPGE